MSTSPVFFGPNHRSASPVGAGEKLGLRARRWFVAGLLMIAGCSVYDALLVFQYREVIDEQNAICRWLISLEPEFVSVFIVGKLAGTALVLAALVGLARIWRRGACATVCGLVAFQIGLMGYLHCADSFPAYWQRTLAAAEIANVLPRAARVVLKSEPEQLLASTVVSGRRAGRWQPGGRPFRPRREKFRGPNREEIRRIRNRRLKLTGGPGRPLPSQRDDLRGML